MEIKSQPATLNASQETVFAFLKDMNNWEQLMPEDKIKEWESTENDCSFTIESLASIDLKMESANPPADMKIASGEKSPFPFTITVHVKQTNPGSSQAILVFDGKVNPFLKTMVQSPLTNFFNMLSGKLQKIFG